MTDKKSILIVDDHPLVREGLKALIARSSGFEVVGEAGSGRKALRLARELKPDLVVMDISLPDKSGIEVTRDIRSLSSDTSVIMVSVHSQGVRVIEALRAGATGYVTKESATERLLDGLEAVSRGEFFLDSSLSSGMAEQLMATPETETKMTDMRYERLTPREQQVMRLLVEGLSPKDIGEKLFISPRTVENHRSNIMRKLDLHTTIELLRYAVQLNLIDVEQWKGT